ncbi:hypothetical protein D9M68_880390 [compost metagenome]
MGHLCLCSGIIGLCRFELHIGNYLAFHQRPDFFDFYAGRFFCGHSGFEGCLAVVDLLAVYISLNAKQGLAFLYIITFLYINGLEVTAYLCFDFYIYSTFNGAGIFLFH